MMQLGTRWDVGAAAPDSLPQSMLQAIAHVEMELEADGIDAAGWRWTLTWLERRAIAELDDGTIVREELDGAATIHLPDGD